MQGRSHKTCVTPPQQTGQAHSLLDGYPFDIPQGHQSSVLMNSDNCKANDQGAGAQAAEGLSSEKTAGNANRAWPADKASPFQV